MTPRNETMRSISEWADETFGPIKTNLQVAVRANEEMAELLQTLSINDKDVEALDEIADIFIVLARILYAHRADLNTLVHYKMVKNRRRKWKIHGDTGTGQHL